MAEYQNPAAHLHPDYDIIAQHTLPLEVYTQVKHYAPSEAARAYPHAYYQVATIGPLSHSSTPCVLCGKGDNCVDHWMRHCISFSPSHSLCSSGHGHYKVLNRSRSKASMDLPSQHKLSSSYAEPFTKKGALTKSPPRTLSQIRRPLYEPSANKLLVQLLPP